MENGEEKIGEILNSEVVWFGGRGEGGGSDFGGAWIISPWAHHFGGVLFSPRIGEKNGGRELTSFLYVDFSFSFFFFLFSFFSKEFSISPLFLSPNQTKP